VRALLVLAGAALVLVGAAAPAATGPRTLVKTNGPLRAFASDGARLAWIDARYDVRTRTVSARRSILLGSAKPFGRLKLEGIRPVLAVAGKRVLWTRSGGGDSIEVDVWVGAPGQKGRLVGVTQNDSIVGVGDGGYFGGAAGDGSTLLWSSVFYRCASDSCLELVVPASPERALNGLRRVVGNRSRATPDAPSAVTLDVSAGRVAELVTPSPVSSQQPLPRAVPGLPVEIRDTVTGRLISTFTPAGIVHGVAISGNRAAVLVSSGSDTSIERYDAATGALTGSTPVAAAAADLDLSGTRIVYGVGGQIHVLDAVTGTDRVLRSVHGTVVGLSIEGRRVMWAVDSGGRGRIVALDF
jgi:hypothetical protein